MNKNMDQKKAEAPILLEKNSSCYVYGPKALQSLLKFKKLKQQDVEDNLNSDSNIKYTMHVFCFIKSPDIDGGKEWHYDYHNEKKVPTNENRFMTGFRSAHNVNGRGKLVSTCGLMFMINIQKMESSQFEKFAADIKNYDSETQIKMLKKAGYKKFTVQLSNKCSDYSSLIMDGSRLCCMLKKLELVDENGKHVDYLSEYYYDPRDYERTDNNGNYISDRSEYINPAHMPFIHQFDKNEELSSIIILNKNAKMEYYNDKSPFCEVENKNPLIFYCEPGSEVAIDILSKCWDEEKYPEFYNATIVFMSPKLVKGYQKNLDNVDTYKTMKEFIKSYKENEAYFSFKMSDCRNYSQQRMDQLLQAQTKFSGTWENFVGFIKKAVFNEKSDVKTIEDKNENNENGENIATQNSNVIGLNQNTVDITKNSHFDEINNKNNKKDIELIKENEKEDIKINEAGNKSEKEPKPELKDEKEMLTQNSSLAGNIEKEMAQNIEIKTSENKDNKIDNPEDHLNVFMQYLKNHLPTIFKFINAIRRFFSRFISRSKNKSKNDVKNSFRNTVDAIHSKSSAIVKVLGLSEKKDVPSNMENRSVITQKNSIE